MFEENVDAFLLALLRRIDKRNIGSDLSGGVWELFVNSDEMVANNFVTTEFWLDDKDFIGLSFDKITKELFFQNGALLLDEFVNEKFSRSDWKVTNPKGFTWPADYFEPFISNLTGHDYSLTRQYSKLIQSQHKSVKNGLISALRVIDSSISNVEIQNITSSQPLLTIESEEHNSRNLLALFGDGTISMFRAVIFIMLYKNHRLMIDEIDAGIHYSRMKDYWKVILQSAKENDVQLFTTTHNRECMEAFRTALEELGYDYTSKSRTITLKQSPKTGDVVAFTNSFEVLDDALEIGNDLR